MPLFFKRALLKAVREETTTYIALRRTLIIAQHIPKLWGGKLKWFFRLKSKSRFVLLCLKGCAAVTLKASLKSCSIKTTHPGNSALFLMQDFPDNLTKANVFIKHTHESARMHQLTHHLNKILHFAAFLFHGWNQTPFRHGSRINLLSPSLLWRWTTPQINSCWERYSSTQHNILRQRYLHR